MGKKLSKKFVQTELSNKLLAIQRKYDIVENTYFVERDTNGSKVPCGDGYVSFMDEKLFVNIGISGFTGEI